MKTRGWKHYEGQGGYAPDSGRIPAKAWLATALVIVIVLALMHVGAAAGY